MMKRTISGMTGTGSLAHNRRDFFAENVNPNRVYLNICYWDENLKDVYKELFDESVERYNVGKRNDRKITNYYDKIQHGKQEKLFHEVIFQIGNNKDMAAETPEGDLAVKVLDEYMQDFQRRNPTLRVFCCYLHQDEATPHLHIDFVPYVTGWKGKGMDTRVSLKQALKSLGFQGGAKHDTELNQWINHEKEVLAEIMERYEIEWEQKEEYHPIGLRCAVPVLGRLKSSGQFLGITFTELGGELFFDTERTRARFAPGTLGEINGMNTLSVSVGDGEPLLRYIRQRIIFLEQQHPEMGK